MFLMSLALGYGVATAQVPGIFQGADLKLGEKLIADNKCVACHTGKVGGDGSAIYRPSGKINTAGYLRGMVEQCNTELNLGFFPEEVTAVAVMLKSYGWSTLNIFVVANILWFRSKEIV